MVAAMKVLQVLWAIIFGLLAGIATFVAFPLILLYAGVKIIGGMASKIR